MGRKIGEKASKRMKYLRGANMKSYFAAHYLSKKQCKAIQRWKEEQST